MHYHSTIPLEHPGPIIPPDDQQPEQLEQLSRQAYAMLPRIKITDLLIEVDEWTNFTGHFTHLRNGEGSAHETEKIVRLGLPRIIRPKENAPELDYSSFYVTTGTGTPAALLRGI